MVVAQKTVDVRNINISAQRQQGQPALKEQQQIGIRVVLRGDLPAS